MQLICHSLNKKIAIVIFIYDHILFSFLVRTSLPQIYFQYLFTIYNSLESCVVQMGLDWFWYLTFAHSAPIDYLNQWLF